MTAVESKRVLIRLNGCEGVRECDGRGSRSVKKQISSRDTRTMLLKSVVLLALLLILVPDRTYSGIFGRTQSAGVRGILKCGNKPAANVKVALYDQDDG